MTLNFITSAQNQMENSLFVFEVDARLKTTVDTGVAVRAT